MIAVGCFASELPSIEVIAVASLLSTSRVVRSEHEPPCGKLPQDWPATNADGLSLESRCEPGELFGTCLEPHLTNTDTTPVCQIPQTIEVNPAAESNRVCDIYLKHLHL